MSELSRELAAFIALVEADQAFSRTQCAGVVAAQTAIRCPMDPGTPPPNDVSSSPSSLPRPHAAPGQAAGYLYQCRYGLLAALRRACTNSDLTVSIELLDDVAFDSNETPIARLQLKHHVKRTAALTDACVDLWKTLAIWAKEVGAEPEQLLSQQLFLVTTAAAAPGSAASYLRLADRDVNRAHALLLAAAARSANEVNRSAYAALTALAPEAQLALLQAVFILDKTPSLADLQSDLVYELRFIADPQFHTAALHRIEGWWWGRIAEALDNPIRRRIAMLEVDSYLSALREEFKTANLTVEFGSAVLPATVAEQYERRTFVRQLRLIECSTSGLNRAKRDYFRAFEERSRWAREFLTTQGEIARFEQTLVENWEPHFEQMATDLASAEPTYDKAAAGRRLLHTVETQPPISIRNVAARHLAVGSYHMLADDRRLGWHPDYVAITATNAPRSENEP